MNNSTLDLLASLEKHVNRFMCGGTIERTPEVFNVAMLYLSKCTLLIEGGSYFPNSSGIQKMASVTEAVLIVLIASSAFDILIYIGGEIQTIPRHDG